MLVEPVSAVVCDLGEAPTWDAITERLYWIDVNGTRLHSSDLSGRDVNSWRLPSRVGSFALEAGENGGALLALKEGIHRLNFATRTVERIGEIDKTPGTWLNDGKVDRQGRFVIGSMDANEQNPIGGIFSWQSGRGSRRLDTGFICSNGPSWSPDGTVFYCADSWERIIYQYAYDPRTGSVGARSEFVGSEYFAHGVPDGCTVDADGYLWSANLFAGRILRIAPDGSLDRVIDVPVETVTSVTFGGTDLDVLFVTSMGVDPRTASRSTDPLAGRLLAVRGLGVQGIAEVRVRT